MNQDASESLSSDTTASTPKRSRAGTPQAPTPKADRTSSEVHIVLQGKGGVGKTLVASLLVQFFADRGEVVGCIDTDPENRTFSALSFVDAEPLRIKDSDTDETNFRELDRMVSGLIEKPAVYVIDNGAGSFGAMSSYLLQGGGLDTMLEAGASVVLHIVVATGPEYDTTLHGAASLLDSAGDATVVLWVNERNGPLTVEGAEVPFDDTPFYADYRSGIRGIVTLRALKKPASDNFADMLKRGLSFSAAQQDSAFFIPEKSRLRRIKDDLFQQITLALTETV